MLLCILSFLSRNFNAIASKEIQFSVFFFFSTCAERSIAFCLTALFGFSEQNKLFPKQKFEASNYMQIGYKRKTANLISLNSA